MLEQEILSILERAVTTIRDKMEANNENASGRTSAGFKVIQTAGHIRLINDAAADIEQLEVGFRGQVPEDIIYQWSLDKRIEFDNEQERRRFAYNVSKNINEEGTKRYGDHVDIYSEAVREAIGEIKDKSRDIIINTFNNLH